MNLFLKKMEELNKVTEERVEIRAGLMTEAKGVDRAFKEQFRKSHSSLYGELQKCYRHRDGTVDRSAMEAMRPRGVLHSTWEKLLELRASRMRIENQLKEEESVLHSMKEQEQRLLKEADHCEQDAKEAIEKIQGIKSLKRSLAFDADCVFELQSGNLETAPCRDPLKSLKEALLVERGVVDSINASIQEGSGRKVAVLEQIMSFRKGIRLLEWEHEGLKLKTEDVIERTKEIQLLRIGKDMHQRLYQDATQIVSSKTADLDRQSTLRRLEKECEEKQGRLARVKRQLLKKSSENEEIAAELAGDSSDLQHARVSAREDPLRSDAARAMEDVMAIKRLNDLRNAQQEEIEELQRALKKWHFRTFPTFVLKSNEYPDEQDSTANS